MLVDLRKASVYQIFNRVTNEHYIGSTNANITGRWASHLHKLRKNAHHCYDFQKSWNGSIISDWDFRILEENIPLILQFERERFWQNQLKPSFGQKASMARLRSDNIKEAILKLKAEGKTQREIRDATGASLGSVNKVIKNFRLSS